jgi:zinc transport system substrate-binding protein
MLFALIACNNNKNDKPTIVCTIFPQYDWVQQILGDRKSDFNVKYLLGTGVDLHSYQANVDDRVSIDNCDLFIYVGGESDEWTEDVLKTAANKNRKTIALLEEVEAKEEELLEGMEEEEEETEDGEEEETEWDEHVWLSLKNAQILVDIIANAICSIDKDNAAKYRANTDAYIAGLAALDAQYDAMVNDAERDTVLFADRFPFRYLMDDYDITPYAAFPGCSAETEASFETVDFLIGKVNKFDLKVILVIEGSDKEMATTIKNDSIKKNQTILVLNSCQSVKTDDINKGATYLSIMTANLEVLRQALA